MEKTRWKAVGAGLGVLAFLFFFPLGPQARAEEKAPTFVTSTLEGKRVALKDYWEVQGKKAVVLSFFATWCQPCKEDLKYLQALQDHRSGQAFQVLCVLTQDTAGKEGVKKFLQELGVSLPVLLDEFGIIGKRYSVTALPCNVLIDGQGILRAKYLGYSEAVKRNFEGRLKTLLPSP